MAKKECQTVVVLPVQMKRQYKQWCKRNNVTMKQATTLLVKKAVRELSIQESELCDNGK